MARNLLRDKPARNLLKKSQQPQPAEDISLGQRLLSRFTDPATEPIGGIGQAVTGAAINPLANIPRIGLSAFGIPEERAATPVLSTAGGILGGFAGQPVAGAAVGATAGSLVEQSLQKLRGTGEDISVGDALLIGGVALAGGKVLETIGKGVGLSAKLIPERARIAFFNKTRQALEVGRKSAAREWRRAVNFAVRSKPDARIDLSKQMSSLQGQLNNKALKDLGVEDAIIPQLRTALSKNPKLLKSVENPNLAKDLTLNEAQDLKNAITSSVQPIIRRAIKGKATPLERNVFDLLDDIDFQVLKKFPEMKGIKDAYSAAKSDFELVRPLLERGSAIESSIFSQPKGLFGLGGTKFLGSVEGKIAFQDVTSKTVPSAKVFELAKRAYRLNRAADAMGRLTEILIGGSAITEIGKSIRGD